MVVIAAVAITGFVVSFLANLSEHDGRLLGVACATLTLGGIAAVAFRRRRARRLAEAQDAEREQQRAAHQKGLEQRYGHEAAQRILSKTLWQGATAEMVREMFGAPEDVSTRVYKMKTTETWKYERIDARRYAKHVTLENGVCVGWKEDRD